MSCDDKFLQQRGTGTSSVVVGCLSECSWRVRKVIGRVGGERQSAAYSTLLAHNATRAALVYERGWPPTLEWAFVAV